MKSLKRLFCKHDYKFSCDIGGDAINNISTKVVYRSIWKCSKCENCKFEKYLHCGGGFG